MSAQSAENVPAGTRSPPRTWISGNVLVAIALGWLIVDRILVLRAPSHWGGPNIGGGLLLLLAVLVGLCGVVMLVTTGIGRLSRHRPSRTPPAERAAPGPGRRARWLVPVSINVLLLGTLVAVRAAATGN